MAQKYVLYTCLLTQEQGYIQNSSFLTLACIELPVRLVNRRLLGPTLWISGSVGLVYDPRNYFLNECPGDVNLTGPGNHTVRTIILG